MIKKFVLFFPLMKYAAAPYSKWLLFSILSLGWVLHHGRFLTILFKLYFLVTECVNNSLLCHKKTHTYKINKLFPVTTCFSVWELMSNWLTWRFWQKKAFHLCALLIVHWGNRVYCRAPTVLHTSRVHARQVHQRFCSSF